MGIALALLGAQLSITGGLLWSAHKVSTGDHHEFGVLLITLGWLVGVVAAFKGRSPKPVESSDPEPRA